MVTTVLTTVPAHTTKRDHVRKRGSDRAQAFQPRASARFRCHGSHGAKARPASNRRKRRERRNTRTRENLWRSDPHFRTTGLHSALWLHKSVRSRSTIFLFVPFVALCDVIYQFKVHAMDLFPSVVAFPRTCTIPPRSMIAHGVATGSRCLHFRANTRALAKNAAGNPTLREL